MHCLHANLLLLISSTSCLTRGILLEGSGRFTNLLETMESVGGRGGRCLETLQNEDNLQTKSCANIYLPPKISDFRKL